MSGHPFEEAELTLAVGEEARNACVAAGFAFFVGGFTRALGIGSDAIRALEDPNYFPPLAEARQLRIEEAA